MGREHEKSRKESMRRAEKSRKVRMRRAEKSRKHRDKRGHFQGGWIYHPDMVRVSGLCTTKFLKSHFKHVVYCVSIIPQ